MLPEKGIGLAHDAPLFSQTADAERAYIERIKSSATGLPPAYLLTCKPAPLIGPMDYMMSIDVVTDMPFAAGFLVYRLQVSPWKRRAERDR